MALALNGGLNVASWWRSHGRGLTMALAINGGSIAGRRLLGSGLVKAVALNGGHNNASWRWLLRSGLVKSWFSKVVSTLSHGGDLSSGLMTSSTLDGFLNAASRK